MKYDKIYYCQRDNGGKIGNKNKLIVTEIFQSVREK